MLVKSKGEKQAGRASQINHGNIAPSIDTRAGGVTVDRVEATTVLSFMALSRLRFPTDGEGDPFDDASRDAAERAARTALAALGLAATVLALDDGFDLRSRCVLVPVGPPSFELRRRNGEAEQFELDREAAVRLFGEAIAELGAAGLSWERDELLLQPAPRLVDLIARSHELAAEGPTGAEASPAGAEA